jgi:hypothetical protein
MDSDSELMKRGGRKRRPRATQVQKVKQSQVVNVTVHAAPRAKPRAKKAAGDMVMLLSDRVKPRGLFKAGYTPAEPLRAAGPGFFFANIPAPSQASAYGNAPAAVRPLSDHVFRASSDPSKNFNQNKGDDRVEAVNPSGIISGVNEVRAMPSPMMPMTAGYQASSAPFEGRPVGPPANRADEVRALPSAGVEAMRQAFARMPTQSSLLASVMPESAFERIPFPPMAPETAAERNRDVIADRNRLGKLMELEAHIAGKGGSEEEQAAVYRDNMRRGGRISIF